MFYLKLIVFFYKYIIKILINVTLFIYLNLKFIYFVEVDNKAEAEMQLIEFNL